MVDIASSWPEEQVAFVGAGLGAKPRPPFGPALRLCRCLGRSLKSQIWNL